MKPVSSIVLDPRAAFELAAELLARREGFVAEWKPSSDGGDRALLEITARYWQTIVQRLNQAPAKNKLAFLDLLGIQLIAAQAARAPIVFQLSDQAVDTRAPAGTRVAAPPPPDSADQIVFETERNTGLAAAKLKSVVSLWPGRDEYLDHTAAFLAGQSFQPFKKAQLVETPHTLYLAHDLLLALAGKSTVTVEFELTTLSSEHLDLVWEYWDGKDWRGFRAMRPECESEESLKLDSSDGLRRSGSFTLETDCAETDKTIVNGGESFWIRARLDEPLPPNPAQILPEVESIQLSTQIDRSFEFTVSRPVAKPRGASTCNLKVKVQDEGGSPLKAVWVHVNAPPNSYPPGQTDSNGEICLPVTYDNSPKTITVSTADFTPASATVPKIVKSTTARTSDPGSIYEVTFTLNGLKPDKAFADQTGLDVSKTFYPLGLQPQPGNAFYFTNQELFSKPGALFQVYLQKAETPQDNFNVTVPPTTQPNPLPHTLIWEYWNGRNWVGLLAHSNDPAKPSNDARNTLPNDFTSSGLISLTVPQDMAPIKINDQDGLWMRVRLISGSFGYTQEVIWNTNNKFTYVVNRPPALSDFRIAYSWTLGPLHAERVWAYNDFQYEDRTDEAKWPGKTFQPFKPVSDSTPTLYLGYDKKLPVDRHGIYFDVVEQRGDTLGPALLWQYWDGIAWQDLAVEDETRSFRLPGLVAFIAPEDSESLARFGTALYWVRARLKEDGPPGEPMLNGIFTNATWAVQRQTITDESLGTSSGRSNQVLTFRQIPVLSGEWLEVQELAGPRANVEWRIVARELLKDDHALRELEALLGSEGGTLDVEKGALRLRRDRNKRVAEVWVRWEARPNFFESGANDRHYVLERARGRLFFGDGVQGKIPPLGGSILARKYRTGGGRAGNVAAKTITQMLGAIGGVQGVSNPRPAEGGADGETLQAFAARGPRSIRHRGRGISAQDYETLAKQVSPAVAVARAIPNLDASGRRAPGWVTLLIIPESEEPRPWPSFGMRTEVRRYLEAHAPADVAAAHQIHVTGPDYQPIDLDAIIAPLDPSDAGAVEQRARAALALFFHPLRGGPNGGGWQLGRDVFMSDVAAVLEAVEGVDYVKELALLLNGILQGDRVQIAQDRLVVAGEFRLKMIQGER